VLVVTRAHVVTRVLEVIPELVVTRVLVAILVGEETPASLVQLVLPALLAQLDLRAPRGLLVRRVRLVLLVLLVRRVRLVLLVLLVRRVQLVRPALRASPQDRSLARHLIRRLSSTTFQRRFSVLKLKLAQPARWSRSRLMCPALQAATVLGWVMSPVRS
jgi:hypothetical protein